ncbi:transporter substrate-binding domain-containing protein [Leucothrix sargassi]|nr:transporter substrate-binding domain-containing protein [Leucothrix sargassi]
MKSIKKTLLGKLTLASIGVLGLTLNTAFADGLMSEGSFKVGLEATYPPFESYDGDKIVGFDPDVAALLAEQMKAEASFIDTKFTGLILGLASNKFDAVISGMYVTEARQKQAYAVPYARTGASILVSKASKLMPETENDLCGLKVGLQQGTAWVKTLNEHSESYCVANGKEAISVVELPTAPEVSQALLSGNVQAQMEINGAAKLIAEKTKGRLLISSPDLVYPQTLGIYLKKDNQPLIDAVESAMKTITENGSLPALIEKYELSPLK